MKFWTRLTLLMTVAALGLSLTWVVTLAPAVGWATLLLLIAAIAAAYPAISEQEDEIGHRTTQDEYDALARWAHVRQYEQEMRRREAMARLRDRAERRRAERGL